MSYDGSASVIVEHGIVCQCHFIEASDDSDVD